MRARLRNAWRIVAMAKRIAIVAMAKLRLLSDWISCKGKQRGTPRSIEG
jgi:hypothetical protein